MTSRDRGVFHFGAFVLDPGEQRPPRSGRPAHLRPKTFAVLRLLVERHPHLVDRQAFFDAVWPDVHVAALARGEPVVLSSLGRFLDRIAPGRWLAGVKRRASVPYRAP